MQQTVLVAFGGKNSLQTQREAVAAPRKRLVVRVIALSMTDTALYVSFGLAT